MQVRTPARHRPFEVSRRRPEGRPAVPTAVGEGPLLP